MAYKNKAQRLKDEAQVTDVDTTLKEQNEAAEIEGNRQTARFDKVLLNITRYTNDDEDPDTESVTVSKVIRSGIVTSQKSADISNGTQDWRNKTADGQPVIIWYVPHGSAKIGHTYAAHDIIKGKGNNRRSVKLEIDWSKQL